MDLNEIEDEYKRRLESSEKKFLEDVKSGRDINKVELEYKEANKEARDFYNYELSKFLKKEKYVQNQKLKDGLNRSKNEKVFVANTSDYGLTKYQKLQIKISILLFKMTFYIKNKIKRKMPNNLLYIYFRARIKTMRTLEIINVPIQYIKNKVSDFTYLVKTKFKEVTHTKS